ncbi:Sterile alpha motif domain-containing protein 11 [Galemys pyrenaicus]|uniref:Sterile alpha motif domain-containing protein 11 n=1 Tax=Galemys pyrenaicus TaxID=202257 RepID=A0A8J6DED3_GALPY|nr:Sterile alpha motif domain-containing protein 11 [Galemys pyrenaicus]
MPAVKKELPGREDLALALAAFHPSLAALPLPPLPGYLAPLPAAAALPPVASLPAAAAGYEALLAPPLRAPRAYLSLHEAAPHLHLPRDPLALERFSAATAAPDFQPLLDNGEPCIEVECGANRALLYVRKLCQGSKGPSIRHRGEWLTPNEFQFVSGRETAKDWKRSIRHKGKSLKTLVSRGILQVHPPICDCPGCRISSPVNRGRLADRRTAALSPARVLKRELAPGCLACDGDGNSSSACGRPGLKRGAGPHVHAMKRRVHTHWDVNISFRETSCSQDPDLPALISSVHRSRHLVMPEHRRRSEFQPGGVDTGLGASGDLLGKRLGHGPIDSDCPLEKEARSQSPQEAMLLSELGPAMAPEDHYRRLVSALSEAGSFQAPPRLYHLGLPGPDLLRARQEAAAARSPGGLEVPLPASPAAAPRRKPGLAQHREGAGPAAFPDRELSQPPPLLSPQNAPHMALGTHLRPPFLGVPSALCQAPGYGFLPPTQAEALARQRELLRKQSLARLEPSSELLRLELEGAGPPQPLAPEADLQRRGAAPLLALPPHGALGTPTPPACGAPGKGSPGSASAGPSESKKTEAGLWAQDSSEDEPPRDSDGEDPTAGGLGPTPGQAPPGGASSGGRGFLSGTRLPPGSRSAASPAPHTGGLLADEEAAVAPEDISKWTVDDVCSFVGGLSGCGEYASVFREQGIDGEALALLTEEHLLTTMGLKLGPALKIRAQVARRLGRVFYVASFPMALPLQPPALRAPEWEPALEGQPPPPAAATSPCRGRHPAPSLASPKPDDGALALLLGPADGTQTLG